MRREYLPTLLLPLKLFFWKVLKQCSLPAPNAAKRRKKKRVRATAGKAHPKVCTWLKDLRGLVGNEFILDASPDKVTPSQGHD